MKQLILVVQRSAAKCLKDVNKLEFLLGYSKSLEKMSRLFLYQIRFFSSKPAKLKLNSTDSIKAYNFESKALFGPSQRSKQSDKLSKALSNENESEVSSEMYWMLNHRPEDTEKDKKSLKRKPSKKKDKLKVLESPTYASTPDIVQSNLEETGGVKNSWQPAAKIPFNSQDINSILKFPLDATEIQNFPSTIEDSDVRYPSVGKVLQATMSESSRKSLIAWKLQKITELGDDGFKRMQEAQLLEGKMFHKSLEDFLCEGTVPQWDSDVYKLWESVSPVLEELQPKIQLAEKMLEHSFLKYRGIVDCVCSIGSETTIIEWKKSEKLKPTLSSTYDAPLQLCAYLGALSVDPNYKLQASKGYVIVANTEGKKAQVHQLDSDMLLRYWYLWLKRLQEFWIRTRDGTLPEPI